MLAQAYPGANTNYTLYTVPAGCQLAGVLFMCAHTPDTVDIAIVPYGQSLSNKHYIFKSYRLESSMQITGLKLDSQDSLVVKALNGTVSFSLLGVVL